MKMAKSLFDKMNKIPVEKKLAFGFGLAVLVVIMFSAFGFHSKHTKPTGKALNF